MKVRCYNLIIKNFEVILLFLKPLLNVRDTQMIDLLEILNRKEASYDELVSALGLEKKAVKTLLEKIDSTYPELQLQRMKKMCSIASPDELPKAKAEIIKSSKKVELLMSLIKDEMPAEMKNSTWYRYIHSISQFLEMYKVRIDIKRKRLCGDKMRIRHLTVKLWNECPFLFENSQETLIVSENSESAERKQVIQWALKWKNDSENLLSLPENERQTLFRLLNGASYQSAGQPNQSEEEMFFYQLLSISGATHHELLFSLSHLKIVETFKKWTLLIQRNFQSATTVNEQIFYRMLLIQFAKLVIYPSHHFYPMPAYHQRQLELPRFKSRVKKMARDFKEIPFFENFSENRLVTANLEIINTLQLSTTWEAPIYIVIDDCYTCDVRMKIKSLLQYHFVSEYNLAFLSRNTKAIDMIHLFILETDLRGIHSPTEYFQLMADEIHEENWLEPIKKRLEILQKKQKTL